MVLKLHRGEVIDVKVISVDPEGWHGSVFGVSKLFVSHARMSESLQNPEWEFDSEGRWYNTKDEKSIQPEDIVRVRVIAETPQTEDTMAIGSMMEEYLGPLNTKGRALY
ncbi:DNA-directed RNA polymerase II subunit RPB7 [Angomonas deanei]|nr:DNA-directed RNA polymerase II subunit RPB7 [Angomonas deanei]EPY42934.1 DNA-directed RNA polymerase II subunit RPB7 [Angomonas deanei]|eukprot:EPY39286.1 DNA-directed RNA polymerase II subunit RPB7 [Angomonas deanei]